jgi:two-component sensor histidine kinase
MTANSSAGFPLTLQLLLWGAANSIAGAAVGLAVGVFREGGFEPTIMLISVLFGNVVGFTVLGSSVVLAPRLRAHGPIVRSAMLALALLSGSVAGTALVIYLFPLFVLRDPRLALAVGAINGVLALIVGGVVEVYEELRWRLAESLREVEEVRLAEARLREHAARAELAALQARINPHFFFNTLNTISSLLEEEPRRAEEIIETLAELFRYTFRASESGPVRLGDELDFVQSYLTIERARFGDRLQVVREVEPAALTVPVPGLILQPLVENAVAHGLAPLKRGGTIRIAARVEGDALLVEVGDDGVGPPPGDADPIREGHGLGNVRQRLETMYGELGSIRLHAATSGRGAVARLRLPVSPAAPPAAEAPPATAPLAAGPAAEQPS